MDIRARLLGSLRTLLQLPIRPVRHIVSSNGKLAHPSPGCNQIVLDFPNRQGRMSLTLYITVMWWFMMTQYSLV
jgi:hypothetical protein